MANDRDDSSHKSTKVNRAAIFLRRIRHRITSTGVRAPIVWWRHHGFKDADVILASYPRSGSTWFRFTLFEILTGKPSSFEDVNSALRGLKDHRHGWPLLPGGGRIIGTHEPYRAVYKKAIYMVRDVRDVALSEFAFEKNLGIGRKDLGEHLKDMLVSGKRHGTWPNHIKSWLDSPLPGSGNLLLIRYEDLRRDSVETLTKVADFLGVPSTRSAVEAAIANNSIQKMREKEDHLYKQENYSRVPRMPQRGVETGGRFVRSGKTGGWQEKLNHAQMIFVEQHTADLLRRLEYPIVTSEEMPNAAPVPAHIG
jgi:estrone sulfotransferase